MHRLFSENLFIFTSTKDRRLKNNSFASQFSIAFEIRTTRQQKERRSRSFDQIAVFLVSARRTSRGTD